MADQSATLIDREVVAEVTSAFHFEKPSGFSFGAGQFTDATLTDRLKTNAKENTLTFSSAPPPFANKIIFTTRICDTAFERSLKRVPLTAQEKIGPAAGPLTLNMNLAKPAIFPVGEIGITPFLSMVQQTDRDGRSQKLSLFNSNRRPEDAVFLDTLKALGTTSLNFSLIRTMTEMSKSKRAWKGCAIAVGSRRFRWICLAFS